uniref:Uncharacterized protein n=1 Tax=Magnetococcus massalia (strain MO-1) TaxID=451514 RepID=A0A1S7LL80_MAGMO|nr:protein of unknown function [Candidatus Magnetococcus massalia]
MDMVIHFPDKMGKVLQQKKDLQEFVVKATQAALEKQHIAESLAESAAQGDQGEYASEEEMRRFFARLLTKS